MLEVGDKIEVMYMQGEPQYTGRVGTVTHIDDAGQVHGTWGGCALVDGDEYRLIMKGGYEVLWTCPR